MFIIVIARSVATKQSPVKIHVYAVKPEIASSSLRLLLAMTVNIYIIYTLHLDMPALKFKIITRFKSQPDSFAARLNFKFFNFG